MRLIPIVILLPAIFLSTISCGRSKQKESGFDLPFMNVGILGYTQNGQLFAEQAVAAPVTVFANVYLHNEPDPPLKERIAKVEMNFGDSQNWEDVTEAINKYDENPSFEILPSHTYTVPGNYHITARLTMNWGEILYSSSGADPSITVLPPEDSGS